MMRQFAPGTAVPHFSSVPKVLQNIGNLSDILGTPCQAAWIKDANTRLTLETNVYVYVYVHV